MFSVFCSGLLNSSAFFNIRLSNFYFGVSQLSSPEQSRAKCTSSKEDGVGVTALLCRKIKIQHVLHTKYFQETTYIDQRALL